jgi:hypothetical protein
MPIGFRRDNKQRGTNSIDLISSGDTLPTGAD